MLEGFNISGARIPDDNITLIKKSNLSLIKAPRESVNIITKDSNRTFTRMAREVLEVLQQDTRSNMREVPVPAGDGGINGSKIVIKQMPLKDKRNSSIVASKRLVKDGLHNKGADFISLLGGESSNQRRIAELFHDHSRNSISPLRDRKKGFSSDQIAENIAAFLDNGLIKLSPGE